MYLKSLVVNLCITMYNYYADLVEKGKMDEEIFDERIQEYEDRNYYVYNF